MQRGISSRPPAITHLKNSMIVRKYVAHMCRTEVGVVTRLFEIQYTESLHGFKVRRLAKSTVYEDQTVSMAKPGKRQLYVMSCIECFRSS